MQMDCLYQVPNLTLTKFQSSVPSISMKGGEFPLQLVLRQPHLLLPQHFQEKEMRENCTKFRMANKAAC